MLSVTVAVLSRRFDACGCVPMVTVSVTLQSLDQTLESNGIRLPALVVELAIDADDGSRAQRSVVRFSLPVEEMKDPADAMLRFVGAPSVWLHVSAACRRAGVCVVLTTCHHRR